MSNFALVLDGGISANRGISTRVMKRKVRKPTTLRQQVDLMGIKPLSLWEIRAFEAQESRGGGFVKAMYHFKEVLWPLFLVSILGTFGFLMAGVFTLSVSSIGVAVALGLSAGAFGVLVDKFPHWKTQVINWSTQYIITPDGIRVEIPFSVRRQMDEVHRARPMVKFYARSHGDDPFIVVKDEQFNETLTIAHF